MKPSDIRTLAIWIITLALIVFGLILGTANRLQAKEIEPFDIDKLAHAVATAETSNCTAGVGVSKRNCFGITEKVNGVRRYKKFPSTSESFIAFKNLWIAKYGAHFPTKKDAEKYRGGDATNWLRIVTLVYNR